MLCQSRRSHERFIDHGLQIISVSIHPSSHFRCCFFKAFFFFMKNLIGNYLPPRGKFEVEKVKKSWKMEEIIKLN